MSSALWRAEFPAPAKLNLFLHVVGRRSDGRHQLQTVFRLIDLIDSLQFSRREDGQIRLSCNVPELEQEDDLCVRAAKMLQRTKGHAGEVTGVDIRLEKRIPMGGGLGGGSSDAATTLQALNHLWGLGLSASELAELALSLGADVPFFLGPGNAFGEGIGEILTPVELPAAWYLVLMPPISVSTASVFAAHELTRNTKTITISSFSAGPKQYQADFGQNDLEPVVSSRYPQVAAHIAWLKQQANARMSGSGACVFAEFATEREAREVAARMPAAMRGFVVRGLDRHPLQVLLGKG